eukprot:COSAG02_NODE_2997_length_7580_cov_8.348750_6_plen_254_part_00
MTETLGLMSARTVHWTGFWAHTGWGCATTMQRHVWGGGSPGATVAAASPEGEGINATDGWTLSTDAIHLFATALTTVGALLHASLPPPTAEKVMSSHFTSPDAHSARNFVKGFDETMGISTATATGSARSSVHDFESGTGSNIGGASFGTSAVTASDGALDQVHESGSVAQVRNGSVQEEARLYQLDHQCDPVHGQGPSEQITPNFGGISLSDSDARDCDTEISAAGYAGGAIASPTRRFSAVAAAHLSGGTH